jgi:hypothetical protein
MLRRTGWLAAQFCTTPLSAVVLIPSLGRSLSSNGAQSVSRTPAFESDPPLLATLAGTLEPGPAIAAILRLN